MSKKLMALSLSLGLLQTSFLQASPLMLSNAISGAEVFAHLEALQRIAAANNGNRAAGTSGHEQSAAYIAQKMTEAGYVVHSNPFQFKVFTKVSSSFERTAPTQAVFEDGKDYHVMSYSPSGDVTASVSPVDIVLGAGNTSTSGCEAEDFANFPRGNIALIQRGTCTFQQKVENADAAGASGVVIFNQGNTADREALFESTLSESLNADIPAFSVAYGFATALLALDNPSLKLVAETRVDTTTSYNVIAESVTGNPENIVMVGAHLDSVENGPGINDNGSGSAAVLEVALKLKNITPTNKLRFAWWSAEELGLVGSEKYVEGLSDVEKKKIALYINVDMIASKNYKLSVYDGDGSTFGVKGPDGSASIEKLTHDYFTMNGLQTVDTQSDGRSDYASFATAGIPFGGLFTGAEGKKTADEALLFGGEVDVAYDACYHSACDDLSMINMDALEINSNALAFLSLTYAHSTASVKAQVSATKSKAKALKYPKYIHGVKYFVE